MNNIDGFIAPSFKSGHICLDVEMRIFREDDINGKSSGASGRQGTFRPPLHPNHFFSGEVRPQKFNKALNAIALGH
jgi:hypothetical protein